MNIVDVRPDCNALAAAEPLLDVANMLKSLGALEGEVSPRPKNTVAAPIFIPAIEIFTRSVTTTID